MVQTNIAVLEVVLGKVDFGDGLFLLDLGQRPLKLSGRGHGKRQWQERKEDGAKGSPAQDVTRHAYLSTVTDRGAACHQHAAFNE